MLIENKYKIKPKLVSVVMLLALCLSFYGVVLTFTTVNDTASSQTTSQMTNDIKSSDTPPANPGNTVLPDNQLTSSDGHTNNPSMVNSQTQTPTRAKTASVSSVSSITSTPINYQMNSSSTSTWYDASTNGNFLPISGDDVSGSVTLPFTFTFYNASFTQLYISSNGWLSFSNPSPTDYGNPSFPTTSSSYSYALAPFWYDLEIYNTTYFWSTPNFAVIEFVNPIYHSDFTTVGTFEVVLFANGDIMFIYQNINSDYGATVGLNFGLDSSYYNTFLNNLSLVSNFAIAFTHNNYNLLSDFEGSVAGWSYNGLWNLRDTSQTYGLAYSPTHAFWYGNASSGTYDTGSTNSGWLNSSIISLNNGVNFLTFETWYYTESGSSFDLKQVYVRDTLGQSTLLDTIDGLQQTWQQIVVDLSQFSGQAISICFFFNTVDSVSNSYQGWYIDDVGLFGSSGSNVTDVAVQLQAPVSVSQGSSSWINATIYNGGSLNVTNASLGIYVNSSLVSSTNVSSLLTGSSYTLSYYWSPTAQGAYNITAFAQPVTNETFTGNNLVQQTAYVTPPLKQYQYVVNATSYGWYDAVANGINLNINGDDSSGSLGLAFNFFFYDNFFNTVYISSNGWLSFANTNPTQYSSPIFPDSSNPYAISPFWTDLVASSNIYGWSTSSFAVIEFQNYQFLSGSSAGTFEVVLFPNGNILFNYQNTGYQNGATVGLNYGSNTNYYTNIPFDISNITNTQILFGTGSMPAFHQLSVSLDVPSGIATGGSTTINATVTNNGNVNETNVPFTIFIDGGNVASTTIASLLTGSSYTLSYSWSAITASNYNVTAYAQPVINETVTSDNQAGQFVYVGSPVITGNVGDYMTLVENVSNMYIILHLTIVQQIDSQTVNMTVNQLSLDSSGAVTYNMTSWMVVNTISRFVENGNIWNQTPLFTWVPTSLNVNDQVGILDDPAATVNSIISFTWQQLTYNVFNVSFTSGGYSYYGLYDTNTGILLYIGGPQQSLAIWLNESSLITVNPLIVNFSVPSVSSNGDVYYTEGSTGNYITWYAYDSDPTNYTIYDNYGSLVGSGNWTSGNPITLNVDYLSSGTYYYTLTVYDNSSYSATNTVYVYVSASIPSVSSYGDIYYTEGSTGNQITWYAYDSNPNTYTIYDNNGYLVASGSWSSGSPINYNVDYLSAGSYYYTLTVYNTAGNSASNTVYVYVTAAPTVSSYGDIYYTEGNTGNQITWYAYSSNPDTYTIYDNYGYIVDSGYWSSGYPIYFNVDGLSAGTYYYTISVTDTAGNSVSNTVYVYVNPASTTSISITTSSNYPPPSSSSNNGISTSSSVGQSTSQDNNQSTSRTTISAVSPGFELIFAFMGLIGIYLLRRKY